MQNILPTMADTIARLNLLKVLSALPINVSKEGSFMVSNFYKSNIKSGSITSPHLLILASSEVVAASNDVVTTPYDVVTVSNDVVIAPYDVDTTLYDVVTTPCDVDTASNDVVTAPYDVVTTPCDVVTEV